MHVILATSQAAKNDVHMLSDMQCLRLLHDFFQPRWLDPTQPQPQPPFLIRK